MTTPVNIASIVTAASTLRWVSVDTVLGELIQGEIGPRLCLQGAHSLGDEAEEPHHISNCNRLHMLH